MNGFQFNLSTRRRPARVLQYVGGFIVGALFALMVCMSLVFMFGGTGDSNLMIFAAAFPVLGLVFGICGASAVAGTRSRY